MQRSDENLNESSNPLKSSLISLFSNYKKYLPFIIIILLVLIVCIPMSPWWQQLPGRDSGVFMYNGWRWLHGEVPYLMTWDHKPPLVFAVDALGYLFFGQWGIWLIQVGVISASAILLYSLLKKKFASYIVMLALFQWLSLIAVLVVGGNVTELYALPVQMLIVTLLLSENENRKYKYLLIGVLMGVLFLAKQTAIGVFIVVVVELLLKRVIVAKEWNRLFKNITSIVFGMLTILGLTIGYFAVTGALKDFFDQVFVYNFAYTKSDFTTYLRTIIFTVKLFELPLLALGGIYALLQVLKSKQLFSKEHHYSIFFAVLLISEYVLSIYWRKLPLHYFLLLPTAIVYFIAVGINLFGEIIKERKLRNLVVGILVLYVTSGFAKNVLDQFVLLKSTPDGIVGNAIKQTASTESVLFWGAEVSYNVYYRRTAGTRFTYQYPLYLRGYASDALWAKLCTDISASKPKLIVDTKNALTPITEAATCFQDMLKSNYTLEGKGENGWGIYKRN